MVRWFFRVSLFVLMASPVSQAQWQQVAGPDGGPTSVVTSNPSNGYVFAVANKVAYRSTDQGVSWVPLFAGLEGSFTAQNVASAGPDTYLWGSGSLGFVFYHSTDFGTTWTPMARNGLPLFPLVWTIAVSGPRVFVGADNASVYWSTDHGANWTAGTGLPAGTNIGHFAEWGGALYAGSMLVSSTHGVFRSTDNGTSWAPTNTPFLTNLNPLTGLTANANALFAGTGLNGVHRATDTGQVWTKITPASASDGTSAVLATSTNLYVCGPGGTIQRSDQSGNGWGPVNTGLPPAAPNESIPKLTASGTVIIAGTIKLGIYRTLNQGTLWSQSNSGLRAAKINDLMAENANLFAASESNGFFRSTDRGTTWTLINTGVSATNSGWYAFARTAAYLLGGTGSNGLYRSTNQGTSWTLSNTGSTLTTTQAFWVGTADSVWAAGNAGVSLSVNGGTNWTFQTAGMGLGETTLDILKNGAFMMMGEDVGGCKRSNNSGQTWNAPYLGLPTSSPFASLARVDTVWLITTDEGVHRSYNRGNNWAKANTGVLGQPWSLLALDSVVYVGSTDGVWKTTNRGGTWSDFGEGFPPNTSVLELAADTNYFYAGTDRFSVWRRSRSACAIPPGGTGDVNAAGDIITSDIIYLVNFVLKGGPAPIPCTAAGDVNCDGAVGTSDIIYLVNFVLKGGPAPCDACTLVPGTWACP